VKRNGRFAELSVGTVTAHVAEELATVRVIHDPLAPDGDHPADDSHAEITSLPPGDSDEALLIGDMIAECVTAMVPIR
jgi:hypothetical protein